MPYIVCFVLKDARFHYDGAKQALNDIGGPDEGLQSRSKRNRVSKLSLRSSRLACAWRCCIRR